MKRKLHDIAVAPQSWESLASSLLASGHRWSAWERKFLTEMAAPSKRFPTERQIERLLELNARALL
jgi:hypothetical protein